jgi:signal peptidase I
MVCASKEGSFRASSELLLERSAPRTKCSSNHAEGVMLHEAEGRSSSAANITHITYTGPSMNPLLKSGDLLEVVPVNGRGLRIGDVILFSCPEEGRKVVHRVKAITAQGIRTKGDNNSRIDAWIVLHENVIGCVTRAQRGKRWRRIQGGWPGHCVGTLLGILRQVNLKLSFVLHPVYHWGSSTDWLKKAAGRFFQTRVIALRRPGGAELHLLMGRRLIGTLSPGESRWFIRRPYRLVVDETSLPHGPNGARHT